MSSCLLKNRWQENYAHQNAGAAALLFPLQDAHSPFLERPETTRGDAVLTSCSARGTKTGPTCFVCPSRDNSKPRWGPCRCRLRLAVCPCRCRCRVRMALLAKVREERGRARLFLFYASGNEGVDEQRVLVVHTGALRLLPYSLKHIKPGRQRETTLSRDELRDMPLSRKLS